VIVEAVGSIAHSEQDLSRVRIKALACLFLIRATREIILVHSWSSGVFSADVLSLSGRGGMLLRKGTMMILLAHST
jgi:hypothetical protein